jgi:dTDP-4-amino-4,6-dideoxygalactose transaminase
MDITFIDLKKQYSTIQTEIDAKVHNVITESAFVGGKYVRNFEYEFARFCNAQYCVGVGNGTDALYIALRSLGIGAGDEVITAANSFIATSEAVTMSGASVVFVDCDPETYNIDVDKIEQAVTKKTKAIIPVHLYGQPANMSRVKDIAAKYKLFIIEDASQAHGATIDNQGVGTFGDVACFSFYPGKNLGAYGDAGAIVTNNEELALQCRMIANHGCTEKYNHRFEGINSRLDGLQAAVLSVKLRYLEDWTKRRCANAALYRQFLKGSHVICPTEMNGLRHVYHLFVIRLAGRDTIQTAMKQRGIATGIHYPIALPFLDAYGHLGHCPADFPVAYQYAAEILSLPMYPELERDQIEYVCAQLLDIQKNSQGEQVNA